MVILFLLVMAATAMLLLPVESTITAAVPDELSIDPARAMAPAAVTLTCPAEEMEPAALLVTLLLLELIETKDVPATLAGIEMEPLLDEVKPAPALTAGSVNEPVAAVPTARAAASVPLVTVLPEIPDADAEAMVTLPVLLVTMPPVPSKFPPVKTRILPEADENDPPPIFA
jgi:hypothetical protein